MTPPSPFRAPSQSERLLKDRLLSGLAKPEPAYHGPAAGSRFMNPRRMDKLVSARDQCTRDAGRDPAAPVKALYHSASRPHTVHIPAANHAWRQSYKRSRFALTPLPLSGVAKTRLVFNSSKPDISTLG